VRRNEQLEPVRFVFGMHEAAGDATVTGMPMQRQGSILRCCQAELTDFSVS
jgi:hypothetical protein